MIKRLPKSFILISILLGTLGFVYFDLVSFAFEIWYEEGLYFWKTSSIENYNINFYLWLCLGGFLFGIFYPLKSLQQLTWIIGGVIFFLFNILVIVSGSAFTFDYAGTIEFTIYYTEVQTNWVFYLIGLGMFCRVILFKTSSSLLDRIVILTIGILMGAFFHLLLGSIAFFEIFHYWILMSLLIAGVIIISIIKPKKHEFPLNENI